MVADWIACLSRRPADRTGEDIDIIYARLKDMKVFERFHPMVLQQICYYGYYEELEEGIVLFRQGDIGVNWYAILKGTLDVNVSHTGSIEDAVTICTLGPGKVFGESVIDDTPRNATVITTNECEIIRVEKKDFRQIWERSKEYLEGVIFPGTQSIKDDTQQALQNSPNADDKKPKEKVPSRSLVRAAQVLRNLMQSSTPKILKEQKYNMKLHPQSFVGSEAIDWLIKRSRLVHGRFHALSMWQALLEEGNIAHVTHEFEFRDKNLLYKFTIDDKPDDSNPFDRGDLEDEFDEIVTQLGNLGPDAMFRMALRKDPDKRDEVDLELIYEELLHIKALSNLSTVVIKDLSSVIILETCEKKGTVLFSQGSEGKSWYIILKGSVNVVVYGKGVVCQLGEGDDFGKLSLVNDAPRTASIETCESNCHFLRVDKDNFNGMLRDVEVNTVRMKEGGREVLVLKQVKSQSHYTDSAMQPNTQYQYAVMAGTPEKMIEHLLELPIDVNERLQNGFLADFLLAYQLFMTSEALCMELLTKYHGTAMLLSSQMNSEKSKTELKEHCLIVKKRVGQVVLRWHRMAKNLLIEDQRCFLLINDLMSALEADKLHEELEALTKALFSRNDQKFVVENQTPAITRRSLSFSMPFRPWNLSENDKHKKTIIPPIKRDDHVIFKVFCADHTYTTVRLKYGDTAEKVLKTAEERVHFGDDCVLCEVKSNSEIIPFKPEELSVVTRLSVNGRLFVAPRGHLESLTPLPEQEGPDRGSFLSQEITSSKEIAYYLTEYDCELFTNINIYELIYYNFGRTNFDKITSNLDIFLQRFNEVHFWVITEICLTTQLNKRVQLLRKFIKIATHCKEYRNWNSFFAIIMALNNVAVSRLSQTWEKLPSKYRRMYQEFESSLDPTRNHRVYRLAMGKMKPPIIPFMAILMKDMTFTHEGNKTYYDDLINFEKMRMITSTLHLIEYCRSEPFGESPPTMKNTSEIASYVRNLQVNDNQRTLIQLSHRLEPRKT